jgi:hypothetical protein
MALYYGQNVSSSGDEYHKSDPDVFDRVGGEDPLSGEVVGWGLSEQELGCLFIGGMTDN